MLDLTALEALGLDTEEGLACCADDIEFYEDMLREYIRESETNQEQMQRFFEVRNWADYRIRAHSLKNTSRMIGASAVSEKAYGLELAAKAGDELSILTAHKPFLAEYSSLIDKLRETVG